MILTRYLYNLQNVKVSLFMSLMDRNIDEALFWGYEIYHSGFYEDIIDYLVKIYETLYVTRKQIAEKIKERTEEWKKENSNHYIIGEIIENMINYKYSICKFAKKMEKGIKCKDQKDDKKYKNIYILCNDHNKYYSYHTVQTMNWKQMADLCKFKVRTELNSVCQEPTKLDYIKWAHDWQDYIIDTPSWIKRYERYNGKVNENTFKLEFDDEDDFENFYENYNLEPDEQKKEIQERCMGSEKTSQCDLKNLIIMYGGTIE